MTGCEAWRGALTLPLAFIVLFLLSCTLFLRVRTSLGVDLSGCFGRVFVDDELTEETSGAQGDTKTRQIYYEFSTGQIWKKKKLNNGPAEIVLLCSIHVST
jgi:hypothetical protein